MPGDLPRAVSLAEYLAKELPRPSWLVEGLWPARALGVIGGDPKAGKTYFLMALALSVALGRELLGCRVVDPGPALLVLEEGDPAQLQLRLRRLVRGMGPFGREIQHADVTLRVRHGVRLDDVAWLEALEADLQSYRPRLVGIDCLARIHGGDENDSRDMNKLFGKLLDFQARHVCSIAVLHHLRKPDRTGSAAQVRLRGSSAIRGAYDTGLYLTKTDSVVRAELEHRDYEAVDPFSYRLIVDEAADTARVERMSGAEGLRLDPVSGQRAERLLAAVSSEWSSTTNIRERANVSGRNAKEALNGLLDEGRIQRRQKGRSDEWRLPPDADGPNVEEPGNA